MKELYLALSRASKASSFKVIKLVKVIARLSDVLLIHLELP